MLPYLEQGPLYNAINFSWTNWYDYGYPINSTVWNMNLAAFTCPSDGLTGKSCNNNYFGSIGTTTDYNCGGAGSYAVYTLGSGCPGGSTGIFSHLQSYSIADVKDGTSNTIAFSEGAVGDPPPVLNTPWRDDLSTNTGYGAGYSLYDANTNIPAVLADLQSCCYWWTQKINYPTVAESHGFRWGTGDPGDSLFQTLVPPNSTIYPWADCRMDCGASCGAVFTGYHNATSFHPGGCNTTMADGSVRFVKSSVAMMTWWALGTRSGSEVLSSDSY
jgi:prepilin-type processing-associated H-X9-DG protein